MGRQLLTPLGVYRFEFCIISSTGVSRAALSLAEGIKGEQAALGPGRVALGRAAGSLCLETALHGDVI